MDGITAGTYIGMPDFARDRWKREKVSSKREGEHDKSLIATVVRHRTPLKNYNHLRRENYSTAVTTTSEGMNRKNYEGGA